MRIAVAPDKFKGSLAAPDVAVPVADGRGVPSGPPSVPGSPPDLVHARTTDVPARTGADEQEEIR
ncbi:hypothetical protein ACFQ36_03115 [Arthrobacter sp. GCM10027362]|uniref:hypothetical protein n=1 Tax=Arthrobacter sp. GCM10027362 TaxID=3273379 RepID=UPI003644C5E6